MADTPLDLDRAALERDLQALTEFGPRPIGSKGEAIARERVEGVLQAAGLGVRRHEFPYLGWSLEGQPSVQIGPDGWAPEALAFTYSPPTPEGGLAGALEWVGQHWVGGLQRWEKFRIADDAGTTVGYVSAAPSGPAVPAPLAESSSPLPHFIIGGEDLARLRSELEEGSTVAFQGTIAARLDPAAIGVNVATTIPGTGENPLPVALCGHLDSMEGSSRAAGATRALVAVLALVRHYARHPAPHPIELVLFTGTEADIAGSKAYLADHPELWDVSLAINVDGIPDTDPLLVASAPEALEAQLYDLVQSMGLAAPPEYRSPLPPGGDQLPFAAVGVPALLLGRGAPSGRDAPRPKREPAEAVLEVARMATAVIDRVVPTLRAAASKRSLLAPHRDSAWEHTLSLKQY